MKQTNRFGETVTGYDIPVLNEREIRAAAGILFLVIFISLVLILSNKNFVLAKYAVTIFLVDFIIRVFVNPKYSPSLIIGRLIVSNQTPEYVGAKQKRFAWSVGMALSGTIFFVMVVLNTYGPISGWSCLACLIFLFFESAFGICLACKIYRLVYGEKAQYCPGEVCDIKSRQEIQKTSVLQLLIVTGFIIAIIVTVLTTSEYYHRQPHELFTGNQQAK